MAEYNAGRRFRDGVEVRATRDIISNGHAVYILQGDRRFALLAEDMQLGTIIDPSIAGRDGTEFLQAALNCAWEAGLRPVGFSDTEAQVRALGRHLEDMRAITFANLKVEKPNG